MYKETGPWKMKGKGQFFLLTRVRLLLEMTVEYRIEYIYIGLYEEVTNIGSWTVFPLEVVGNSVL